MVRWCLCCWALLCHPRTVTRLAKWRFGGLLVVLRAWRQQLGWHVGFKLVSNDPSSAQHGQIWPQDGSKRASRNYLGSMGRWKACKVAVWRPCCGLENVKRATWMPSWLQDGLGRAKVSPRRAQDDPKMAPRWLQELSCRILSLSLAPF